jgi:outer membrane protein OmpA-like peptidoglycan-associated protein
MTIFRCLVLFCLLISMSSAFAGKTGCTLKPGFICISETSTNDSVTGPAGDTVVIRFDYKQSALYYAYTFEVLDSVIKILLHDTAVKITINGYAYMDEGNDTICYYLSLNRALFIQTYVLGRGVDSSRITFLNAYGKRHQQFTSKDKDGFLVNCRAELIVVNPPPPKQPEIFDRDEDGIADNEDKCPEIFGFKDNFGCPVIGGTIVPFGFQESTLYHMTFNVLDSVIAVLKENPALSLSIDGHAYIAEGTVSVCEKLALDRAEIVKLYLVSRYINTSRILSVKNYGTSRPINPGKNPQQVLRNARAEIRIMNNE